MPAVCPIERSDTDTRGTSWNRCARRVEPRPGIERPGPGGYGPNAVTIDVIDDGTARTTSGAPAGRATRGPNSSNTLVTSRLQPPGQAALPRHPADLPQALLLYCLPSPGSILDRLVRFPPALFLAARQASGGKGYGLMAEKLRMPGTRAGGCPRLPGGGPMG